MLCQLEFTPFFCNGNMTIRVLHDQKKVADWHSDQDNISVQILSFEIDAKLTKPFDLTIVFRNKNQELDTILLPDGSVKDKAIMIHKLTCDNVSIKHQIDSLEFFSDNQIIKDHSCYFGFNGYLLFSFRPNLVQWMMDRL